MANNELLNKLKKIHKLKKEDIEAAFKKIAKEIFNNYLLKIKDNKYRITEIEFYLHCNNHPDPYVHKNIKQKYCKQWYFHRYKKNDNLKGGNYKGLDITFGNNERYFGILIRSIEKQNNKNNNKPKNNETNNYTEGPCKVVNCILREFGIKKENKKEYKEFVEEIEKSGIFENNKLKLDFNNKVDNEKYYKAPRVGLKPARNKPDWDKYIMKPYRYLLFPGKTTKERNLLTLGFIHEKHNRNLNNPKDIIQNFNNNNISGFQAFNENSISKYIDYYEDGKKEEKEKFLKELIDEINTNFSVKKKCKLYGLLNKGEKK